MSVTCPIVTSSGGQTTFIALATSNAPTIYAEQAAFSLPLLQDLYSLLPPTNPLAKANVGESMISNKPNALIFKIASQFVATPIIAK